jgi:endonuclease/exonuclease/phosphatase family metal-dependent hydrolase
LSPQPLGPLASDRPSLEYTVNCSGRSDLDSFRVLSLNLWHDPSELHERMVTAASLARTMGARVLLLQEVPSESGLMNPFFDQGYTFAAQSADDAGPSRAAVLTDLGIVGDAYSLPGVRVAMASLRSPSGRDFLAISSHLAWGGLAEGERLSQAIRIDDLALKIRPLPFPAVWAGDFNALPESATLRFLQGLQPVDGRTAQWTDAWVRAGSGSPFTSSPRNRHALTTALKNGFQDASMLPDRRIDYVLVRGYANGHELTPLSCRVLDETIVAVSGPGRPASDHWGVLVDLWDPAP